MSDSQNPEDRFIELKVQIPSDLSWDEVKNIEDEISEAAGDILKEHGLARNSHHRIIEADYTSKLDDGEE